MKMKGYYLRATPHMQHFLLSLVSLFILVGLCYFVCLGLGSLELYFSFVTKAGFALGGRALTAFLLKMGCSAGFALTAAFALRALLGEAYGPHMMIREEASSGANPRLHLDLNLPPEIDPYNETDPDRIKKIFEDRKEAKICQIKNEILSLFEKMVKEEMKIRRLDLSNFDFENMDRLAYRVLPDYARALDFDDLSKRKRYISLLKTNLYNDRHGKKYQLGENLKNNLLDWITEDYS